MIMKKAGDLYVDYATEKRLAIIIDNKSFFVAFLTVDNVVSKSTLFQRRLST